MKWKKKENTDIKERRYKRTERKGEEWKGKIKNKTEEQTEKNTVNKSIRLLLFLAKSPSWIFYLVLAKNILLHIKLFFCRIFSLGAWLLRR
jgi:hypothetical protein